MILTLENCVMVGHCTQILHFAVMRVYSFYRDFFVEIVEIVIPIAKKNFLT